MLLINIKLKLYIVFHTKILKEIRFAEYSNMALFIDIYLSFI